VSEEIPKVTFFELRMFRGKDYNEALDNWTKGTMVQRNIGWVHKSKVIWICPKCYKVHEELHRKGIRRRLWCPHCGWSEVGE